MSWYTDQNRFDVTFTPSINSKQQKIALRIGVDFNIRRPERLNGKSFDEIMKDATINRAITELDAFITSLLRDSDQTWFFHGHTYEGCQTYFRTYIDELRYLHDKGRLSGDITNNPQFWIDLDKPSYFEDKQIISTIGDLIIANYDFRKSLAEWR